MPKKIEANVSTLLDLKAELFRKKEAFQRLKQATVDHGMVVHGKPILAEHRQQLSKAKKETRKVKAVPTAAALPEDDEQLAEQRRMLEKSRQKLISKAALYEKLSSSKRGDIDDEESGQYLVNFERKAYERNRSDSDFSFESGEESEGERESAGPTTTLQPVEEQVRPEEEWVEFTDSLGRTRRCMKKDLSHFMAAEADLPKRKERSFPDAQPSTSVNIATSAVQYDDRDQGVPPGEQKSSGPTHYQHVLRDEAWDHGVAYFQFSTDEAVRQEQMKKLQMLRHQTDEMRLKTERIKQKRKEAMEKRLQKVIERKNLNVPLDVLGLGSNEEEVVDASTIPLPEETDVDKREEEAERQQKRAQHVRPWDVGKKRLSQEQWVERRREERQLEFRPPDVY